MHSAPSPTQNRQPDTWRGLEVLVWTWTSASTDKDSFWGLLALMNGIPSPPLRGPATLKENKLPAPYISLQSSIGPVADLHINNQHLLLDGYDRDGVFAEGQFPGPLITGYKGDNWDINVINDLEDPEMLTSTSIHWHGIFQRGSNWADGAAFVNQCPIVPGSSFHYKFHTPDQAGTFWYHSHLSTQYCDGLRGPMVMYDAEDPHADLYDVDDESTVITLSDWYHTVAPQLGGVPEPNSTLINGKGRYPGGPQNDLAVIRVEQGKRYRFRLINMSCAPNYVFSIDNHGFDIIEVDGENTLPLTVDSVQVFAGQRYSIVVTANQTVDNFWIRASPNEGPLDFDGGINSAVLRYEGASEEEPCVNRTMESSMPFVETNLHPLVNEGVPGNPWQDGADVNLNLQMTFNADTGDFAINGETFVHPTTPVLLQILSGVEPAQNLLPSGSVYELPLNKSIQISLPPAAAGSPHPFHLHGHSFDVVRSAGSAEYNYVDPVRRDVVSTGHDGDNVTIRFFTDNVGPWFLHCHIDWHLETGLAVILAEGGKDSSKMDPVPEAWNDLCPAYNALTDARLGGVLPAPE
ncbi:multicopper oxidase [Cylindrobasidium torrendii FP15055 ss-10]|uniref:laccase n=1 Tax=Cylindrobasidium torrendii FP15055 ss-10 TaxID=1314674 RepID=A0A0D7BFH7_9AGAR|nr:multicopper oxidase [Cylindrobasidium torrendii FP15055 ss-10]